LTDCLVIWSWSASRYPSSSAHPEMRPSCRDGAGIPGPLWIDRQVRGSADLMVAVGVTESDHAMRNCKLIFPILARGSECPLSMTMMLGGALPGGSSPGRTTPSGLPPLAFSCGGSSQDPGVRRRLRLLHNFGHLDLSTLA
jgi:hypothetical protein